MNDEMIEQIFKHAGEVSRFATVQVIGFGYHTFKQYLRYFSNEELMLLSKKYKIKEIDSRNELIDDLAKAMKDEKTVGDHLDEISDLAYTALLNVIGDQETISVYEAHALLEVEHEGYCFLQKYSRNLLISSDMIEILKHVLTDPVYMKRRKSLAYLKAWLNYESLIRDKISVDELCDLTDYTKEELMNLYKQLDHPVMKLSDDLLISPYHATHYSDQPSDREIKELMNYGYPLNDDMWKRLFDFITVRLEVNVLDTTDLMGEIFKRMMMGQDASVIANGLASKINVKDLSELIKHIDAVINHKSA